MHAESPLKKRRALVIDNDVDSREAVGALLSQAGMAVALAESVSEAMAFVDDFAPNVVISLLTGQAELDLARQIRQQKSAGHRISFIALTTLPDPEVRAKALLAGFNVCLVKPVPPGVLLDAIARTAR
jgi:CheY-like chemotaxis protein